MAIPSSVCLCSKHKSLLVEWTIGGIDPRVSKPEISAIIGYSKVSKMNDAKKCQ